jgi:hypothetical protein
LAYALGINGVAGIIAVTITGHWPSPHDAMHAVFAASEIRAGNLRSLDRIVNNGPVPLIGACMTSITLVKLAIWRPMPTQAALDLVERRISYHLKPFAISPVDQMFRC